MKRPPKASRRSTSDRAKSATKPSPKREKQADALLQLQGSVGNKGVGKALRRPDDSRPLSYGASELRDGSASGGEADGPPRSFPSSVRKGLETPGRPLDSRTRAFMESRMGSEFEDVRIHTSPDAAESASRMGVEAYASGNDVVFAPNRYAPDTESGRTLLAHELAHVVQQRGADPSRGGRARRAGNLESSARAVGVAVAAGSNAHVSPSTAAPGVQMESEHRFGRGSQVVVVSGGTVKVNATTIPATVKKDGSIVYRGREIVLDGDGVFRYKDTKRIPRKCNPHYYDAKGKPRADRPLPTKSGNAPSSQYYDPKTRRNESWTTPTVERTVRSPSKAAPDKAPQGEKVLKGRIERVHRLRTEFENRVKVAKEKGGLSDEDARAKVQRRMVKREPDAPSRGEFEDGQTYSTSERKTKGGVKVRSTTAAKHDTATVPASKVTAESLDNHVKAVNKKLGTNVVVNPQALAHAEVKQAVINPKQTTFYTDRPMCPSCQRMFVLEAKYRGRDLVVFDPDGTARTFTKDGRILEHRSGGVYERKTALTKGKDGITKVQIGDHPRVVHSAQPTPKQSKKKGGTPTGDVKPGGSDKTASGKREPADPKSGKDTPKLVAGSGASEEPRKKKSRKRKTSRKQKKKAKRAKAAGAGMAKKAPTAKVKTPKVKTPKVKAPKVKVPKIKAPKTKTPKVKVAPKVSMPKPKVSVKPGRPMPGRGGGRSRGGGSGAGAAGAALVGAIAEMVINHYMQKHFADKVRKDAERLINEALKAHESKFDALLEAQKKEIQAAQAEGRQVTMHIAVDTTWQDTDIGRVLINAKVAHVQLVFEDGPPPVKYKRKKPGGFLGDAFRLQVGSTMDHQTFQVPLEGTDPEARRKREERKKHEAHKKQIRGQLDPRLRKKEGQVPLEFEALVLESYHGGVSRKDLKDYAADRAKKAKEHGDDADMKYWNRMKSLTEAPLETVIQRAKVKSVSLAGLRQHAVARRAAGAAAGGKGEGRISVDWAKVIRQIDAPLGRKHLADRQRFQWSQPASKRELAKQAEVVASLQSRLSQAKRDLAEASRSIDRNDNEPPHPDWTAERRLKGEIRRLRNDLQVEKKLLKSMEKGVDRRRIRRLMSGPVAD